MKNIINLIKSTNDSLLIKKKLDELHVFDIANILLELDQSNREKIYKLYTNEELADIVSYLDEKDANDLLNEIDYEKKIAIINEMEPDDALDVIQEAEADEQVKLLSSIDTDLREDLNELKEYEDYTVGAIMTTHYITASINEDIKLAMRNLVKDAPNVESINTIFVVDDNEKLYGIVNLKDLIIAKSPCLINNIMNTNYKFVESDTDIEVATKIINDYDIYDLPVVDNGILKGIITMDDAIDSLVDEASEDYAKLAGLTTDQDKDEKLKVSIKKRIPWLIVLLILDLFIPLIASEFDYLFAKPSLVILIVFQPVVLGLAGNSATQSLAISIRSISNNSIDSKNGTRKHLGNEFICGILLGIILGILSFGLTLGVLYLNKNADINIFRVALTVGLSTSIALLFSNLVGSIIPICFYKLKIDPAVASGPFITTIIDAISIVVYFVIATVLLYNII